MARYPTMAPVAHHQLNHRDLLRHRIDYEGTKPFQVIDPLGPAPVSRVLKTGPLLAGCPGESICSTLNMSLSAGQRRALGFLMTAVVNG